MNANMNYIESLNCIRVVAVNDFRDRKLCYNY